MSPQYKRPLIISSHNCSVLLKQPGLELPFLDASVLWAPRGQRPGHMEEFWSETV